MGENTRQGNWDVIQNEAGGFQVFRLRNKAFPMRDWNTEIDSVYNTRPEALARLCELNEGLGLHLWMVSYKIRKEEDGIISAEGFRTVVYANRINQVPDQIMLFAMVNHRAGANDIFSKSGEMFNAIMLTLQGIKAVGGYVMINGGKEFLTDLMIPHKVQLGAYKDKTNARKMAKALKAKGFSAALVEMDKLLKVQAGAFSGKDNADQRVQELHDAGFSTAKRISLHSGKPSAFVDGVTQEEVFSLITDYEGKGKFSQQSQVESEAYQAHIRRLKKNGIEPFLLEYTRSNTLKIRIKAFCDTVGAVACISDDVNL